jgi:hypothetical protein
VAGAKKDLSHIAVKIQHNGEQRAQMDGDIDNRPLIYGAGERRK